MKTLLGLTFAISFLFFTNLLSAQNIYEPDLEAGFLKNSLSFSLGFAGFAGAISGNLDRIITSNDQIIPVYVFGRLGFGKYFNVDESSPFASTQLGIFTGNKRTHIELTGGVAYSFSDVYGSKWSLAGSLGLRFQKPGSHFMTRVGAGWPETYYLGFGLSF